MKLAVQERRRGMPFDGERMKKVRKARRITQKKLAAILQSAPKMISQYEHGIYQPNASTLDAIANALDCSLDFLFKRTDEVKNVVLSSDEIELLEAGRRIGYDKALANLMSQTMSNRPIGNE